MQDLFVPGKRMILAARMMLGPLLPQAELWQVNVRYRGLRLVTWVEMCSLLEDTVRLAEGSLIESYW